MIEETAIVTKIADDGRVWIKSQQTSACSSCLQQTSCGTATLAKILPKREFAVDCDLSLQVGDRVVVAIDDAHLLLTSLLMYFFPLLLMLAAVGVANFCLPVAIAERWLPETALLTLLLSFWLIHRFQDLLLLHLCFKPQIIRKSALS